jgi:hypothetical protein
MFERKKYNDYGYDDREEKTREAGSFAKRCDSLFGFQSCYFSSSLCGFCLGNIEYIFGAQHFFFKSISTTFNTFGDNLRTRLLSGL